jgi:transposase-like protein
MPWQEVSVVTLRQEFVVLAQQPEANVRALCQRFEINPSTGYKWLSGYTTTGSGGINSAAAWPR